VICVVGTVQDERQNPHSIALAAVPVPDHFTNAGLGASPLWSLGRPPVQTPPGEREAHAYNWIIVLIAWATIGFFFLHTLSLWTRSWQWVVGKLIFLAIYWIAIQILM